MRAICIWINSYIFLMQVPHNQSKLSNLYDPRKQNHSFDHDTDIWKRRNVFTVFQFVPQPRKMAHKYKLGNLLSAFRHLSGDSHAIVLFSILSLKPFWISLSIIQTCERILSTSRSPLRFWGSIRYIVYVYDHEIDNDTYTFILKCL